MWRIALAQINTEVGNFEGNLKKILDFVEKAKDYQADIVIFPEMAITGYPPEDLLLRADFIKENLKSMENLVSKIKDIVAIVGFIDKRGDLYNSAAVILNGEIVAVYHKNYLPNYGVFDEQRYFSEGEDIIILNFGDSLRMGITICEDIWLPAGPSFVESVFGYAHLISVLNASPFHKGKSHLRYNLLSTRAFENLSYIAYCNLVGGQDELVFDGNSMIFNPNGEIIAKAKAFEEDIIFADIDTDEVFRARLHDIRHRIEREKLKRSFDFQSKLKVIKVNLKPKDKTVEIPKVKIEWLNEAEEVYKALILGVRDYTRKNGFQKVVIGISGGIDSALTSVIAVDALGKENVIGLIMPSRFTSKESLEDAWQLVKNLGIKAYEISIEEVFKAYLNTLEKYFGGRGWDTTEENIQARIRGNFLMAFSNKFGWLVLTTGNKSEMAVGYSTLYGDLAGGFAVLKDVPKTLVYKLAEWRNKQSFVIPERILKKPPSAELKKDQKDEDTLPPYSILDPILHLYVEEDASPDEIISLGYPEEYVAKTINMIDRSEYKRRQAPPGIKITPRAFGKDRRYPITNKFRRNSKNEQG